MTPRLKLVLGVIAAVAWLSQIIYLLPMPQTRVAQFLEAQASAFDSGSAATLPSESKDAYLQRMRTVASEDFWTVWIGSVLALVFGLFAAVASMRQWRGSTVLLMLSSLVYVFMWSIFNGVFTSKLSIPSLFVDMWKVATILHTEAVFVHRDVLLLLCFVILALLSAISIGADVGRNRKRST